MCRRRFRAPQRSRRSQRSRICSKPGNCRRASKPHRRQRRPAAAAMRGCTARCLSAAAVDRRRRVPLRTVRFMALCTADDTAALSVAYSDSIRTPFCFGVVTPEGVFQPRGSRHSTFAVTFCAAIAGHTHARDAPFNAAPPPSPPRSGQQPFRAVKSPLRQRRSHCARHHNAAATL